MTTVTELGELLKELVICIAVVAYIWVHRYIEKHF